MSVEVAELLSLLGLALLITGSLVLLFALLRAFLAPSGEQAPQRAVGIVFIGPFPIIVGGRSAKLVLALSIASLVSFLALFFLIAFSKEVPWP